MFIIFIVTPTYYIVPLDDGLRTKLKDPDNCLIYKLGHDAPHCIHVGVKRVAEAVDSFVTQRSDPTQCKNLFFVVGSPKSGKTTEAMVVIPHLLEPHIAQVAVKRDALFCDPTTRACRKVYIDCSSLVALDNIREKTWKFYECVADKLKVAMAPGVTADNVSMLAVEKLFRAVSHYTIVTIDEYQMLLANLSVKDTTTMSADLRDIMLDPNSACLFVLTGSTSAALISSLEKSPPNGTSVFKGSGLVCTDLNSTADSLADVRTLLAHYGDAPSKSPSLEIQSGLGFRNCAAENVVSGNFSICKYSS